MQGKPEGLRCFLIVAWNLVAFVFCGMIICMRNINYQKGALKRSLGIKKGGVLPPGALIAKMNASKVEFKKPLSKKQVAVLGLI